METVFKSGTRLCAPILLLLVTGWLGCPASAEAIGAEAADRPATVEAVTFNKDIAPIIFRTCAPCHHAGQAAPFGLVSCREVAKRAKQIAEVTQSGYMPPWLPEQGYGEFAHERRLTSEERDLIQQWAREGAPEGTTAPPPPPQFPQGWTLGEPDLVVTVPREYILGAEGPDVYRNFVIPNPGERDRFVRALEFSAGNPRIVHHAFIKVDAKRASRRLEAQEEEPGFPGIIVPAEMPAGQFLTWQPGKRPSVAPEGLSWVLPKNSDLVLQVHLNRSGKIEKLQPSIGLYFTDRPPSRECVRATLTSLALDIPAGETNYVVTDSVKLPVDVQVLSILPHAHYLAKRMESVALLPDGTKQWLLLIKDWDFRWQGDYQYKEPVRLPKGSTLHLRFTYDNSTNNLHNPNPAPKRVRYGPQSSDEMCELWFQMVTANGEDAAKLRDALSDHLQNVFRSSAEHRLALNSNDAEAHLTLGKILFVAGNHREAAMHFARAAQIEPTSDLPHSEMGALLRSEHRLDESKTELETAVRLNPKNSKAYGHLGFVYAEQGNAAEAARCFKQCLALDPTDSIVEDALTELEQYRKAQRER